jgi:hypothetical protein
MTKKIYKQSRLWQDDKRFKNNKQSRLWLDDKRDLRTTSKVIFGWMTKEI